ncbi:MAG: DUF2961 domain-containing protein [Candidatus Moduliflexus flocculans]|nr:DUF2961 domain-containing protein [Candidatus Moduliflexus flocculans]
MKHPATLAPGPRSSWPGSVFLPACRDDDAESAGAGVLDGLARPQQGRSMPGPPRPCGWASCAAGPTGRDAGERSYDPKAEPRGDADGKSNWDNFNVPPGATHVLMDAAGPGRHHPHLGHLPRARAPGLGGPGLGQPPGDACCGCTGTASRGRRSKRRSGDFFANCFGQRSEVISLPVVVEGADSYNCFWRMPFRKSARIEIENQSDKPLSLLYYNIDWIKLDRLPDDTPYFYAQYRQEYPVAQGPGLRPARDRRARATTSARSSASGCAARPGSARATRRSTSTARPSPRSGARARRTISCPPGASRRPSTPYFGVPYFDQRGDRGGHTSAYRWHIHDPIVFNTGIKVTFEHLGWMSAGRESRTTRPRAGTSARTTTPAWPSGTRPGPSTFAARGPGGGGEAPAELGPDRRPGLGSGRAAAARDGGVGEGGRRAYRRGHPLLPAGPVRGRLAGDSRSRSRPRSR